MSRGRIIVIEGADASGKTTLGDRLSKVLGKAHRIHLRVHKRLPMWQYAAIRRAIRFSERGEHTIIDRHFISEQIYAAVFRGGVEGYMNAYNMDQHKLLYEAGATYVLCTSPDTAESYERYMEHARKRDEWFGEDERMYNVIQKYWQLWNGASEDELVCPTKPMRGFHSFIDLLTMNHGVKDHPNWVRNIHMDPRTIESILNAPHKKRNEYSK